MAEQGIFTLPPNILFGVSAFTNAAKTQTITVTVDGSTAATFTGSGMSEKDLGTKVLKSGKGAVKVSVKANGKVSDLVSVQVVLTNKLNFALVGSEDAGDKDYNDSIVVLNWPLG